MEPLLYSPQRAFADYRGASYAGFSRPPAGAPRQLRAGEALRFDLAAGDLVTIVNQEGGAPVLLIPFEVSGENSARPFGIEDLQPKALPQVGFDSHALDGWMAAQGGKPGTAKAFSLFGDTTLPGERFTIRVRAACTLWLALEVRPQSILRGGAGGRMTVEVRYAKERGPALPDPIGELREEFRVERATARAYRVAKGEYLQIIDVEGRQCSDFMAMRANALDQGKERFIDSTVTRTMVRGAYPMPGLADKFFDQDMRPLLAVVQDTVGRHDTFGLACTGRGYEDRGFPGHVNCSDNISRAYAPYGIESRAAWPAVNFFFNAWIDNADNRFASDEAWSRPGDYVVMQALTDLVCVSTACPDDVDPINGWNPTDIHVRLYNPDRPIRRAVAYRPEPHAEMILTQESAFHSRTSALTRSFQAARDVWLPTSYEGSRAIDEYWACREAVTLQDMSSLRKFDIMGPDAEKLLQRALTRDLRKVSVNRGVYALMLDDTGAVIDDGTLFRLSPDVFRWCCGSDDSGRQLRTLAEAEGLKVWIKSLFSSMANLALQGPKSRDLMRKVAFIQPTHPCVDRLKWFGWTVARLDNREGAPFLLTRTGFTGELGYEIFCDRGQGPEIWDRLMAAGEEFGITPMGSEALEIIRIEAGLMSLGAEFAPEVDALEAGLGFAIDKDKEEYIGRAAVLRNAEAPRRRLVGLIFDGDEAAGHGDGVFVGQRRIGTVTSATRSPMLGCAIAMARVASEHTETGTRLEVGRLDGHMKRLGASVTAIPFIDPKRERARA